MREGGQRKKKREVKMQQRRKRAEIEKREWEGELEIWPGKQREENLICEENRALMKRRNTQIGRAHGLNSSHL